MKKLHISFLACFLLLFAACGGGGTNNATPTVQPVNGFGTMQNHTHSMVILPDAQQTIVLATHYGIFRSQNHGASWQETAAGPNQLMQGLMTWWLSYNPLNPQRLYVLTLPAVTPHAGTLGLYTSGDGGKTWQMSIPYSSLPTGTVYFAHAGNEDPNEVYIYQSGLGANGLKVSHDNGAHFTQAGSPLPFGSLLGMLPLPNKPGHILVFGNEGAALTGDGGQHWQVVKSLQDSIFEVTTPGPNQPIYAKGADGIYVSRDNGQSFTLATQNTYAALTASPQQPDTIYGKTALAIYRSTDAGKTWNKLPAIKGNLEILIADPNNPNQLYLALSYPSATYHFASDAWKSLTPPAAS
ncbi:MAG TPA: hypothetical protein VF458_09410 [Ktedonobacteraceae bacterium]